jgi:hypothetical protein
MAVIDDTKQIRCPDHAEMARKVDEMHIALLGDMEKQGWISKNRNMENALRIVGRAMWAGLGIFFVALCSFLWAMLTHTIDVVAR